MIFFQLLQYLLPTNKRDNTRTQGPRLEATQTTQSTAEQIDKISHTSSTTCRGQQQNYRQRALPLRNV